MPIIQASSNKGTMKPIKRGSVMNLRRLKRNSFCFIVLLIFLSGCKDAWVTPSDTSAANLDVKINVLDYSAEDRKNIVIMQFLYEGKYVRFAGNESVSCNGVELTLNELVFGYAA